MSTAEERMQDEIDELEQENRLLRARNERLERESVEVDLLEALKDALCALEVCGRDFDHATSKARTAIAKATNHNQTQKGN